MTFKTNRNKKLKLWRIDPRCHYCGVKTIVIELQSGDTVPDNLATINHIHKREDGVCDCMRKEVVLSCYRCGQERNRGTILIPANELVSEVEKEYNITESYKYHVDVINRLSKRLLKSKKKVSSTINWDVVHTMEDVVDSLKKVLKDIE